MGKVIASSFIGAVLLFSFLPAQYSPAPPSFKGVNGNLVSFLGNAPADSGIPTVSACGGTGPCAAGSLSSAQILALFSSPVAVVPGQGSGTLIAVDQFYLELIAGGTAYSSATGVGLHYTNAAGTSATGQCNAAAFLNAASNAVCLGAGTFIVGVAATTAVNQPLVIMTTSSNPTLGTGTINYWIRYRVLTGF